MDRRSSSPVDMVDNSPLPDGGGGGQSEDEVLRQHETPVRMVGGDLRALVQKVAVPCPCENAGCNGTAYHIIVTTRDEEWRVAEEPYLRMIATVGEVYGVSLRSLRGTGRTRKIAQARHVAMFLLHTHGGLSHGQIGIWFGGRDHSTVIYGCRRGREHLQQGSDERAQLVQIYGESAVGV